MMTENRSLFMPQAKTAESERLEFHAKGLEKYYNGLHRLEVLKGIDLELKRGEMVAIVGASGTGKTTLLHILGTLDRPSSGLLLHRGQDLFAKSDIELSHFRNRTIGFVFQFHHLLPEFSAIENVMMPGMVAGLQHSGPTSEPIRIGMFWLDAHPDFNTPETTRSGSGSRSQRAERRAVRGSRARETDSSPPRPAPRRAA